MSYHILHVFPSDVITGTVSHVLQLAEIQKKAGDQVFLATDKKDISNDIISFQIPVTNRSISQRIKNILALRKIIKKHRIDIIHSHSRAASWISYYAVKWTGIPQVSTIHGRQHPRKRIIGITDVYGSRTIGICPNLLLHLEKEIGLKPYKLYFIPNGFDFTNLTSSGTRIKRQDFVISIIGRFNGNKGRNSAKLLEEVFPYLLEKYTHLSIQLVGGEWHKFTGKDQFELLEEKFGSRISYLGFQDQILPVIQNSDLVIGSGRIAIETAWLKIPVLVLGEACYYGFLTEKNIQEAIDSNFGDIVPLRTDFVPDTRLIREDLENLIMQKWIAPDLSKQLQKYSAEKIVTEINRIYHKALALKKFPHHIPVLLYHKITDDVITTKHRTYVTVKNFRRQMFHLKLRGKTPITFKDYLEGITNHQKLPKRPVILTYDDGYSDNYRNVLPILNRYHFKAVLFLIGNSGLTHNDWDQGENPDDNRLLSVAEIKEFIQSGWEIGAHTMSHPDLTQLNPEEIRSEIVMSKTSLEETYHTKIISFAYPYGKTNEEVKEIVRQTGFEFGITTNLGGKETIEDDRFEIFRVNIYPEDNLFQFHKKISRWYRLYYKRTRGK